MFERIKKRGFQVRALHHAEAILNYDMGPAVAELESVLLDIAIPAIEIVRGGGGETKLTQRIRKALSEAHGWRKHKFEIKKIVDGEEKESVTHEIDHVRSLPTGTFALEIEWNNKDPFFDRDLENFKRLHADGVISIGAIVTRGESLHEGMRDIVERFAQRNDVGNIERVKEFGSVTDRQIALVAKAASSLGSFERGWAHVFVSDKYGEATTHWRKLMDRVERGVGNPCPLLLIGIPRSVVID